MREKAQTKAASLHEMTPLCKYLDEGLRAYPKIKDKVVQ
jgi:hypothetical protein